MGVVVVAFDSYKGCLSASDACRAAAEGIDGREVREVPVSDGGEGMLQVLVEATGGCLVMVQVHDALMRPCIAEYGVSGDGSTAIIEMARVCGLTMLPKELRDPEKTTTYGMGEVIANAISRGCSKFIIGIGGTSTNDAGTGMMQALGFVFRDAEENEINATMCGRELLNVRSVDASGVMTKLREVSFTVACDVDNPLFGENGAAYVYAPQKGADDDMVKRLDAALRHYSKGSDEALVPGSGAAGGMGYALKRYFNAELKPGVDIIFEAIGLDDKLKDAEIVITGEGQSDRQTLMGKAPFGVLERAKKKGVQVVLLSGVVEDVESLLLAGYKSVRSINDGCELPVSELVKPDVAKRNIRSAARQVVSDVLGQ